MMRGIWFKDVVRDFEGVDLSRVEGREEKQRRCQEQCLRLGIVGPTQQRQNELI
jgi:hypothetical protein